MGTSHIRRTLKGITAEQTHQGYFSIDKKGKFVNSATKGKDEASDDVDAYDLIMKNKERLLDLRQGPVYLLPFCTERGVGQPERIPVAPSKLVVLKYENGRRLAGGFASVSTTMANGWTQTFLPGMSIQSMF